MDISTKINNENIRRTLQVLIDNGIEKDEAPEVLIAIGATLLDSDIEDIVYNTEERED